MTAFAERELDVMNVLWTRGPSTAAEVRDALAERAGLDLAYNSVLTILRILEDKGHVDHTVEGRAHRYAALVARADAGRSALRRLIDSLFDRSPELLLTELVRDRSLDDATVRRLRAMLDEADTAPAAPAAPARGRRGKGGKR
jgi:predicted transcriptional regulator